MFRLKRFPKLLFLVICLSASLCLILNLSVTSRQGINYAAKSVRMPLYIKIIEFFDRDYQYKRLVKEVCQGCSRDEDKVLALFKWTHQNIKTDIPETWPIVDDHVWSIIVRGYGARDQLSDVFTVLCNYAGIDAYFDWVYPVNGGRKMPLSFVKIEERWTIFDPYYGSYFKNKNGEIADIEEIKIGSAWSIESLNGESAIDYAVYFKNFPAVKDIGLLRANIQSPLNRLRFETRKLLNKNYRKKD